MFLIFDLDDTLIDTSGCVTPHALKNALQLLLQGKETVEDFSLLQKINASSLKTPIALETFSKQKNISTEHLERAIESLKHPLPSDFVVSCTPSAKEILRYFAARYPLALVTGGHPPFQLEKLEKAGIEVSLFSKIGIPEDSVKKPFYDRFAREIGKKPEQVWVCGDRIPMDLQPAHELGFNTIHMRWGRGQQMKSEPWIDHSISTLSELRNIIP
ncbi:MAG TPA: HAD family hydrolase [Chlamydiales bacterium]